MITKDDYGEIQAFKERLEKIKEQLDALCDDDDIVPINPIDNEVEVVNDAAERQVYRTMMPTMSPFKAKENINTYLVALKYRLEASHIPKNDVKVNGYR